MKQLEKRWALALYGHAAGDEALCLDARGSNHPGPRHGPFVINYVNPADDPRNAKQ